MNPSPVILGILQNQWFKEPERVRMMFDRQPHLRRPFIARTLFMGCKTGLVLRRVFGEWCERITWEEASPEIGSRASSVFPPDPDHLRLLLIELRPRVVLGFGEVALAGLDRPCLALGIPLIRAPHPAARAGTVLRALFTARQQLESYF